MFTRILKETFLISWGKTVIAGTIGGIFSYFTFLKSMGYSPGQSVCGGLAFLMFVYLLRALYVTGKVVESEQLQPQLDKVIAEQLEPLKAEYDQLKIHFGNSMAKLNTAFSAIDYLRSLEDASDATVEVDRFIALMKVVCNNIRDIFEQHTGLKYAVSIKVPMKPTEYIKADSRVMNICRDDISDQRDNTNYRGTVHTISNNTCFNFIFNSISNQEDTTYYLNNNIPNTENYSNSGTKVYGSKGLPYKSELIVPIIAAYDENIKYPAGFLCVDCNDINGFEKDLDNNLDVIMLEGVAEGIYDVVIDYSVKLNPDDYVAVPKNSKVNFRPRDRKKRGK